VKAKDIESFFEGNKYVFSINGRLYYTVKQRAESLLRSPLVK